MPYLQKFHHLYPKVVIDIDTHLTKDLIPLLRNGSLDLVILNLPHQVGKDIKIIPCRKIQDCFAVNKNFNHLVGKKIKLEELNNFPIILQAKQSNTRTFLDNWAYNNDVILKPILEVASYNLVVEFTKIGMGIGYVTKDYIKKELEDKNLFELDIQPPIPQREIGIAVKKDMISSFTTQKFIDMILNDK